MTGIGKNEDLVDEEGENMFKTRDDDTELLIDLLQGAMEEEGYRTKRFSDSEHHKTSEYDAIEVKGNDGNYYMVSIKRRKEYVNPRDGIHHFPYEIYDTI